MLTVTQMLRKKGVVGKFVEFFGPGLENLRLADRATIANMAPEYGATCGIFPVDAVTIDYLRFTGRSAESVALAEAYMKEQGLFHTAATPEAVYSDTLALDLGTVEPSLAGPRRPQDRVALGAVKASFLKELPSLLSGKAAGEGAARRDRRPLGGRGRRTDPGRPRRRGRRCHRDDLERRGLPPAPRLGGDRRDHVVHQHFQSVGHARRRAWWRRRRSRRDCGRSRGSRPVSRRARRWSPTTCDEAGLDTYLDQLNFNTVGYGCTTCIGNSGPLPPPIVEVIQEHDLVAVSVLSGNRNFEGRISPDVRANYLASPPLVVAYALAGRIDLDLATEPLGTGKDGAPVFLKDVWPSQAEIEQAVATAVKSEMFRKEYADVFAGDEAWSSLAVPEGETFAWQGDSTYVRKPPYFDGMTLEPKPVVDIAGARCLALLGDSITTDHISPAGSIKKGSPAGKYLEAHGCGPADFNSYGSRRGNHEVMVRGTFANVRIRNRMTPEIEGGATVHLPDHSRCRSTTPPRPMPPRACRSSCSPARSTAPARRATGRRRGRRSRECGR